MTTVWNILVQYHEGLLSGLKVTLELCMIIWSAGIILGSLVGVVAARFPFAVGWPTKAISFILGGIPILVFLFWLHFPLQSLLEVVIDPFWTASFALSILNIFMVSDIVSHAIADFPQQYILAARVSGMTGRQTLRHIQAPIILRQILPGLLTTQVYMLQASLFASLISVEEIFRVAQRINASIYKPVEIYTALGLLFLAVCLPLNGLAYWLKQSYTRNLSEH